MDGRDEQAALGNVLDPFEISSASGQTRLR